jgi:hypothetical protein
MQRRHEHSTATLASHAVAEMHLGSKNPYPSAASHFDQEFYGATGGR